MEFRKDVFHELAAPHFQMFPTVDEVAAILAMADDDSVSLHKIAQAIEGRPMIAAAMIKTVNAASLGAPRPISSIRHALALMGLERVRTILLEVQEEAIELRIRNSAARMNGASNARTSS